MTNVATIGDEAKTETVAAAPAWRAHATELQSIAAQCDTMCLNAGLQLGDAVPGLLDLATQLVSLAAMLDGEDVTRATQGLVSVAQAVAEIADALTREKDAVAALIIRDNGLSRGIENLVEEIRFLSAIVSNVKIELASIDEEDIRLRGFGDTLQQLAASSQKTIRAFQEAHDTLIMQLKRTAKVQADFETSHRAKLCAAAGEIRSSLDALSQRRTSIAIIAGQVGGITQQIGMQIAQSVGALQIGDSTRQRLEHASEAIVIAADLSEGLDKDGHFQIEPGIDGAAHRSRIVARICGLQSPQIAQSTSEFAEEITTIDSLLRQIAESNVELLDQSKALVSSPGDVSRSFLGDLERKLALATDLIEQCGQSRKLVDETASSVISTIGELEGLAVDVAGMAMDMTIIGTNAVVTSHRLGKKGTALSVIAQHLRTHALRVTDAALRVKPALADVLLSANHFSAIREGQDASSIDHLTGHMATSLVAFRDSDGAIVEVQHDLEGKVSTAGQLLRQAIGALEKIDVIEASLGSIVEMIDGFMQASDDAPTDADPIIDQSLRPRYTMASERVIHDAYFAIQ